MKICALLVPREMKLEHSGGVKAMTDEQLERSIELIQEMIAKREAGANAKVIEGVRQPQAGAIQPVKVRPK
jgi:ketopantoate hydroxymethyltransferase